MFGSYSLVNSRQAARLDQLTDALHTSGRRSSLNEVKDLMVVPSTIDRGVRQV